LFYKVIRIEMKLSRFALILTVVISVFTLTIVAMSFGVIEEHNIITSLRRQLKSKTAQGIHAIPQAFQKLGSIPYAPGKHKYSPFRRQGLNEETLKSDRGPVGAQPPMYRYGVQGAEAPKMFRYGVQGANSETLKQNRLGANSETLKQNRLGANSETLKQNRLGANTEFLKADRVLGTSVAPLDYTVNDDNLELFTDSIGVTLEAAYGQAYQPDAPAQNDDPMRSTIANAV
jgi:hypothetical protein